MRILVSTALLSPYRVDWLNELGKYAQVDILYLEESNSERNMEWLAKRPENCSYRLMKGMRFPKIGKISFSFIKQIKKSNYDIIILDGYGFAAQVINMLYLNSRKMQYFVNVDGIVPKDKEPMPIRAAKRFLLSGVAYFLCGSKATNKILKNYIGEKAKIINHPFSSLYNSDIYKKPSDEAEKQALRSQLGIKEKQVVISVGRFSYLNGYGKGYDVLLKAAKRLPKDIGWYIVGGEPTDEFIAKTEELGLSNVHYVDFKPKDELKLYYRASDAFVLMTVGDVWGLVVNEAMACGLPVITTDKCVAGLELVTNGETGYIVPVGDDEALSVRLEQILSDKDTLLYMGEKAIECIQDYTIESMAKTHISVFKNII